MSSLAELIAKQKEQVETPSTQLAEVELGGELKTFEFTKMPSKKWLDLRTLHPMRAGSTMDRNVGFNMHSLVEDYPAEFRREVDGEERHEVDDKTWHELIDVLAGIHIDTLATAIWGLNDYEDRMAVDAARKALQAAPSKKRSSRAS